MRIWGATHTARKWEELSELARSLMYTPIYNSWCHMRRRCNDPKNQDYYNYGARGIKVCERWESFSNFVEDMYSTWQEGLSLDRIDNDGSYNPENCKWSCRADQNTNRRNTNWITIDERTQSMSAWLRELSQGDTKKDGTYKTKGLLLYEARNNVRRSVM